MGGDAAEREKGLAGDEGTTGGSKAPRTSHSKRWARQRIPTSLTKGCVWEPPPPHHAPRVQLASCGAGGGRREPAGGAPRCPGQPAVRERGPGGRGAGANTPAHYLRPSSVKTAPSPPQASPTTRTAHLLHPFPPTTPPPSAPRRGDCSPQPYGRRQSPGRGSLWGHRSACTLAVTCSRQVSKGSGACEGPTPPPPPPTAPPPTAAPPPPPPRQCEKVCQ